MSEYPGARTGSRDLTFHRKDIQISDLKDLFKICTHNCPIPRRPLAHCYGVELDPRVLRGRKEGVTVFTAPQAPSPEWRLHLILKNAVTLHTPNWSPTYVFEIVYVCPFIYSSGWDFFLLQGMCMVKVRKNSDHFYQKNFSPSHISEITATDHFGALFFLWC